MTNRITTLAAALAFALLPHGALHAQGLIGRNLLVNGGADQDNRGWTFTAPDSLETDTYGHSSGEWDYGISGAPGGGVGYFRFGIPEGHPQAEAHQDVSVAALAAAIDANTVRYTVSGYFGGWSDAHGSSGMTAEFLDAQGKTLGQGTIEPQPFASLPEPRAGEARLGPGTASGDVPAGTRTIRVHLIAKRMDAEDCPNCAAMTYADNLSLVLSHK